MIWLGFLVGALLCELVLRTIYRNKLNTQEFPTVYQLDEQLGYRYKPRGTGRLCQPGVCRNVAVNAEGWLGPHYERSKPPGVYRIAIVGSSNETGWWSDGQSQAVYLEGLLRQKHPNTEVYNFSIDGQERDYEQALVARDIVPEYHPDLVILYAKVPFVRSNVTRESYKGYVVSWGADIPGARELAHRDIDSIESHQILTGLYNLSYIARAALQRYYASPNARMKSHLKAFLTRRFVGRYRWTPMSSSKSVDLLVEAQQKLQRQGTKLIVLSGVFATGPYRTFPPYASSRGLNLGYLAGTHDPRHFNPLTDHLSDAGQQEIARQLAELIAPDLPQ